ncbi:hypothetical protein [Bacillus haynesii]|uniref:hypothetical protein n=1 Tax=Bacillus haynesii TaxID=1925021 RepID=UPI00227E397A|nr:hypothetical protein [Bacillus haynesii]MCY9373428.1 hypothetical protein [Bacillus haynesii]
MMQGLSEQVLKKIHAQEGKIRGTKNVPDNILVANAKKELEEIFSGGRRVNPKYARETLIALNYARENHHFTTGRSMLDDIINHKRIVFNNYLIEYR